jgi:hypothetical protein
MIEVKKIRMQQGGLPSQWLVKKDGEEVGLLERYENNSGHPWKAYLGLGMGQKFLGSFYGKRQPALEAIVGPIAIQLGYES